MIKAIQQNTDYGVDENGSVYSIRFNKQLAGSIQSKGYKQIFTFKDGKHKAYMVHRLIWETFMGPIPDGLEIDHINRNRTDNRLENLRVVTHKENIWNRMPAEEWAKRDPMSDETKLKISNSNKGKKRSLESKLKMSDSQRARRSKELNG